MQQRNLTSEHSQIGLVGLSLQALVDDAQCFVKTPHEAKRRAVARSGGASGDQVLADGERFIVVTRVAQAGLIANPGCDWPCPLAKLIEQRKSLLRISPAC